MTATNAPDFTPSHLAEFLRTRRDVILERWREAVADRPSSQGLSMETLIDHIPDLLDAIADTGEAHLVDSRSRIDTKTAERHALERLAEGLDLSQVVIELAVLRDCILQVWDQERAPGAARPEVRFLNRSVDRAMAASIERYTQSRDRTLKALDRISATALEARRLDDLLQRLLEVMVETTSAVDIGAILLRDGDELILRAEVGLEATAPRPLAVRIGEGFVGRVAAEGRPRLASEALLETDGGPLLQMLGLASGYAVPLLNETTLVGVALIGSFSAPEFSAQDQRLFQAMAARATSGIVQHVLQETAETRAAELSAVIEGIPDALWVGDAGGIRHANRAALAMLGARSVDELHRTAQGPTDDIDVRRASTGEPLPREQRPFERALRGETVSEEIVFRSAGTGQDIVVRAAAAPVRLGNRVAGAVVVATDVTGQKRAAEDRQRLLERAEQAVADRDHVLAVVSHELRNPLNTVTMAAAILKDMVQVPEPGQKSIASIVRSAELMKRMIQDLLDMSSIDAGHLAIDLRPLDAKSLVQEVAEAFESEAAKRGLTLTPEVEDVLPMIRGDRDRLFQALANLVGNALKVTGTGGVVVSARSQGGDLAVVFSVRDTGPGIPGAQLNRVFEPYWRGQSTYKGTGLGLAIARGVVEAHGGRIWVESTPGAGTTFFLAIPNA